MSQGTVSTESVPLPLQIVVQPNAGPATTVDPTGVSFSLTQGGSAATQALTVSNHSASSQTFSATATTNSGGNWLSVSPANGTIAAFGSATMGITVNPANLAPSAYSGTVTVAIAGGQSFTVSVLATVSGNQPNLVLSATGLRFQAVTGGTVTPPQTVTVLNSGAGSLNYTVQVNTLSGGNWLSVSPAMGSSSGTSTSSVTFSVNAAGLAVGDYYGEATFLAPGSANSLQAISVVLNVVPPGDGPGASIQPSGLIFVGLAGGSNPAPKTLSITNPSPNALTYLTTTFTTNGLNWLTVTPVSGSVSATQPASLSIQPALQGLTAGVYIADLVLNFISANPSASAQTQTLHAEMVLIVVSVPSASSVGADRAEPRASGCTPTKLIPVFTGLGSGFAAVTAWPPNIAVTVDDDCGTPLTSGSVSVSFSNGDPALSLTSNLTGVWSATWNPVHATSNVTITGQAQEIQPPLAGTQSIGGSLTLNPAAPSISTGGVVSAASYVANQPLAPGAFAAVFGTNLGSGLNQSLQLPLSTQLAGTSVVIGGEQSPLLFTSGQQINAVIPYDLPANSTQQLLVQMGAAISIPQPIAIASAQPAVFTMNAAGTGAAIIQAYKPDGTPLPYGSPVTGGDVIVIYCSGLGAVSPAISAGSPAPPAGPLSNTVNPVTVTIGGSNATVEFSGLTPGFAQLYQVNVVIPSGLPSGNATLLLSVSGQQSALVTIPMQ